MLSPSYKQHNKNCFIGQEPLGRTACTPILYNPIFTLKKGKRLAIQHRF